MSSPGDRGPEPYPSVQVHYGTDTLHCITQYLDMQGSARLKLLMSAHPIGLPNGLFVSMYLSPQITDYGERPLDPLERKLLQTSN